MTLKTIPEPEKVFSNLRLFATKLRCSLNVDTLDALQFLKQNYFH